MITTIIAWAGSILSLILFFLWMKAREFLSNSKQRIEQLKYDLDICEGIKKDQINKLTKEADEFFAGL